MLSPLHRGTGPKAKDGNERCWGLELPSSPGVPLSNRSVKHWWQTTNPKNRFVFNWLKITIHIHKKVVPCKSLLCNDYKQKSGTDLKNVVLYLSKPIFSHGQLYVAFLRVKSPKGLKILMIEDQEDYKEYTKKYCLWREFLQASKNKLFISSNEWKVI